MACRLRRGLHWCVCAGRIVFLDVVQDRYFCMPRDSGDAFLRIARAEERTGDHERLRGLMARGLLLPSNGAPFQPAPEIPAAEGDHGGQGRLAPLAFEILRCMWGQMFWGARLRFGSLEGVLEALVRKPRRLARESRDLSAARLVAAFSSASLLLPAADRCLVRALAMQSSCRRAGLASLLVFGVRLDPFRAHCWVQLDRRVLVGDHEQTRLFTPILVLG